MPRNLSSVVRHQSINLRFFLSKPIGLSIVRAACFSMLVEIFLLQLLGAALSFGTPD